MTDLKITGKVAQFGNAMIAEVSEKLLGQFVDCLEKTLVAQQGEEAAPSGGRAEEEGDERTSRREAGGERGGTRRDRSFSSALAQSRRPSTSSSLPEDPWPKDSSRHSSLLVVVGLVIYRLVR